MLWLTLITTGLAQDYSGRSADAWMEQISLADFELSLWKLSTETLIGTANEFQDLAFSTIEAGGTGQEHLEQCREFMVLTGEMAGDLGQHSAIYGPQWTWASNNTDALSPEILAAVENTLASERSAYVNLVTAQHTLGSTCMMVAMMSDEGDYAGALARDEMALVQATTDMPEVDHDTVLMAAITVAEAFSMPELQSWLDLSDAHCASTDCAAFAQEVRADNSNGDVGISDGSPGLLSRIHRDVTVGYNYIGATHQLGLQGRTGLGPLAVRGGYVYGFDRSHGWNVKLGLEKWWGETGQFGLGTRGVIDAYGAAQSAYVLDRTLGVEVPVGLRVHLGNATLGVHATPRWNQASTRRSTELPSWLHELHTHASLALRLDRVSLVVTGEWARTGGGTLWGPTVGLRF